MSDKMVLSQNNKKTIDELFAKKKSDEQFIKDIMSHLKKEYLNEKTLSNKISTFKRYIKQNNMVSKDNLNLIGDDKLRRKLNKEREDMQEPSKVRLYKSVIDNIIDLKNEDNTDKLLIFLIFVTGRRPTEFINGNWSVKDGKLYIDKLSKKREEHKVPDEGYEIRLIDKIKPDEFMTMLNKFKTNNKRTSTEAARKASNRVLKNKKFEPITKLSDLRPLYVQYLKNYDSEIRSQNGNQAIKNVLHHNMKTTSIMYNDRFDIVKSFTDDELKRMTKAHLKNLLIANGINKDNTKGFNKLRKDNLIVLIRNNEITKKN